MFKIKVKSLKESSFWLVSLLISVGFLVNACISPLSEKAPGLSSSKPTSTPINLSSFKIGDTWQNSKGLEFVYIPSGKFLMGSPASEEGRHWSESQKTVTIERDFLIGKFEVTQGQWQGVMGNNPSQFQKCGPECPVDTVSWYEAREFLAKLNSLNDGFTYSLPTEAEWEYAARAGTSTAFAFGDTIASTQANFNGEAPYGNVPQGPNLERTVKVGSYKPNAWGIYDMHGNVGEWVEDDVSSTFADRLLKMNYVRGLRGGHWYSAGNSLRSASRGGYEPYTGSQFYGFRVVARPR